MSEDINKYFIGKVIKVDRGGPESRIGMLMDAGEDFLCLLTVDDGIVYYNTKHIKSFTDNLKGQMEFNIEVPKDLKFKKAANFQDLLDSLKLKWVKINRGGPEKLEGVISDVCKEFVSLINNDEIVRLSMFHIKNISYGVKVEKAEEKKCAKQQSRHKVEKSNDNSQNKKNKNKSKKRTSQKTTVDNAEISLAYPLSTKVSSQNTVVEDVESDLSIPLSTNETSQKTAVDEAENNLSIPLSTNETSQKTPVNDAESNLSVPLSANETSQKTAVDEADDLSVLLSTLEKFLRKYSSSNQN
jgi:hypothetical protein